MAAYKDEILPSTKLLKSVTLRLLKSSFNFIFDDHIWTKKIITSEAQRIGT